VRIASLLVVMSACGPAPGPLAPQGPPSLLLVRCVAAQPLPHTGVDGLGALDADAFARPLGVTGLVQRTAPPGMASVMGRPPMVSGTLDAGVVNRIVKARFPQLRACYAKELPLVPGMVGSVTVSFTVGPDGKVTVTRATSVGITAGVSACVVRVIQMLQFPTGQAVSVTYPFSFTTGSATADGVHGDASPPGPRPVMPWTPFALDDGPPPPSAPRVARATAGAVRLGLPAIASCFAAPALVGSLRAMLAVRGDGAIAGVRAGGLGDAGTEACVAARLGELRVATPVHDTVEIACDFSRGEARPWRVTPAAGYAVIEATGRAVRHGEATVTPSALDPAPLPAEQTFLVVAGPDTTGAMLELAFAWAEQGDATVVALRDGGTAPVYLGVAVTAHQVGGVEVAGAWPTLRVGGGTLTACVERSTREAPLGKPEAVDAVVRRVAARCRAVHCGSSLGVTIDPDATARELSQITGATRRAGFERVLFGSYPSCTAARHGHAAPE
jgi:hypothetical protein